MAAIRPARPPGLDWAARLRNAPRNPVPTTSGSGLALLLEELAGGPAANVTLLRGNDQATAAIELAPAW